MSIKNITPYFPKDKNKTLMFKQALDRIRIKIFPSTWSITEPYFWRDIRNPIFSEPIKYYGLSKQGWYSAFIRCDDVEHQNEIDAKADILFGLYYLPTNLDNIPNWSEDTPIMCVDSAFFGMYNKQIFIDNRLVRTYRPDTNTWNSGQTFWIQGTKKNGIDDFLQPLDIYPPIPM